MRRLKEKNVRKNVFHVFGGLFSQLYLYLIGDLIYLFYNKKLAFEKRRIEMRKNISYYKYFVLISFTFYVLTGGTIFAQTGTSPYDYLDLGVGGPASTDLVNDQISDQSFPADLQGTQIAPEPLIITTSNGDYYLYQGDGLKAKLSMQQDGTDTVTFFLEGSPFLMRNEFGEEFTYEYTLDGATVNLINSQGAIVSSEAYQSGHLMTVSSQGSISYSYDEEGNLVSSDDEWGNVTNYLGGKPHVIIDSEGNIVGSYKYSGDNLESFTDQFGNITYFKSDGRRPNHTTNAEGTTTQVYHYDSQGNLDYVVNNATNETTQIDQGYYSQITNQDGAIIGVYNYNIEGYTSSLTEIGGDGVVTGWTEFDDWGRAIATYNAQGTLIQQYVYNDHGFLTQTISLGDVDPLTGDQTILTYTVFDNKGRPEEVYQLGEGDNYVLIQSYEYKENGLLDLTYTYGIERDEDGEAILGDDGQPISVITGMTEFDTRGRPSAVYSILTNDSGEIIGQELTQRYIYNNAGFLSETYTYGANQVYTGKTQYDDFSRPTASFNVYGQETQIFLYNDSGFLQQTVNYGENGTITGWTAYNSSGKPSEVYNHEDSLVQKYMYDDYGLLLFSFSLTSEDGVASLIVSTVEDIENIAALWNDDWNTTYATIFGDMSSETLTAAAWENLQSENFEAAIASALKCIILYSDEASAQQAALDEMPTENIAENWALNDVGTCYFILGQTLGIQGMQEESESAYKIQASEFKFAQAFDARLGTYWSVSNSSRINLTNMGTNLSVVTGYTQYGGDSRPVASYQYYDDGVNGLQASLVQEYVYDRVMQVWNPEANDGEGAYETQTVQTGFVVKTLNYGDIDDQGNPTYTGFTVMDSLGRQQATYNDEDQLVQTYNYSNEGFLKTTFNYNNGAFTGMTIFDNYSRPTASFNMVGIASAITDEMITQLSNGFTEDIINDQEWQPFLIGLTQTFEYGADGFLASSKSWGEATEINVIYIEYFTNALGSAQGDTNYNTAYDFNDDGVIDDQDTAIFEEAFTGAAAMIEAIATGSVDRDTLNAFVNSFVHKAKYQATFTGETHYDKYGKAESITNTEGVTVQTYEYNERGFLTQSHSWGVATDENGTVILDGDNNPVMTETGRTVYDEKSKPLETYSCYDDNNNGIIEATELALVQTYVYENGFLTRTNNLGDYETATGYTLFDSFGRQLATYNDEDKRTTAYIYSRQGFLTTTYNWGLDGAYLGKTVFNKQGKPIESYNMYSDNVTLKGLTQRFVYNDYGFLQYSENLSENQTLTGTTYYDGNGKAIRAENAQGVVVTSYEYNEKGFMTNTNNLAFVEITDPAELAALGDLAVALDIDGVTITGYYVLTGYTLFDEKSRPTESWSVFNDGTHGDQHARIQEYVYRDGFVTETLNYGNNGEFLGKTAFDGFGRQAESYNHLGELTTRFIYSYQGFLDKTFNYGIDQCYLGYTDFGDDGRPTDSYNQAGSKVQQFVYSATGLLDHSISYAENETVTGTTQYDFYGKAQTATNAEGAAVQAYEYNEFGFLQKTISLGEGGVTTGWTEYDDTQRPTAAYNHEGSKIQDFVYERVLQVWNPEANDGAGAWESQIAQTGFMTKTLNYGDNETLIGSTIFNVFGQQVESFNELGEMTTRFIYSAQGFLKETHSLGLNGSYQGKTLYNDAGRPLATYNIANALVQSFNYSENGFLESTTSHGEDETETGTTFFDQYGKQTHSVNLEGETIQSFVYNERGFLTRSNTLGVFEVDGESQHVVTGYTLYDEKSRPTAAYSVYDDDWDGQNLREVKIKDFVYEKADGTATGFVSGEITYTLNLDDDGNAICTDNIADTVGTEIIIAGRTTYDHLGRPSETYNENDELTSRNIFSAQGFLKETHNFGEHRTYTGKLTYTITGRPDTAYNYANAKTTEYYYNSMGMLGHTLGFSNDTLSTRTEFDVYSKATATYQLFTGNVVNGSDGYQYASVVDGGTPNYSDGGASGGALSQVNHYNEFGMMKATVTMGRSGNAVSYTLFDKYQRPTAVYNAQGADLATFTGGTMVQEYFYSDAGFLDSTQSYYEQQIDDETWKSEPTTTTHYDNYGRQWETYTEGGALQNRYQYSANGFLSRSESWQDGTYAGYVVFDASGRQTHAYNPEGSLNTSYYYDIAGFLLRSTSHGG